MVGIYVAIVANHATTCAILVHIPCARDVPKKNPILLVSEETKVCVEHARGQ